MRTQSELDTARDVRRIMVKHWIDLGRISIRCQSGRLMLYGLLKRIPGVAEPLTTPIVEGIFSEIKRLKGVRFVSAHIDNWTNKGGMWRPVEGYVEKRDGVPAAMSGAREQKAAKSFTMRVRDGSS